MKPFAESTASPPVKVVRARLKAGLARWRGLRGDHWLEAGVEDRRLQLGDPRLHRLRRGKRRQIRGARPKRAARLRLQCRVLQFLERERGNEFLRRRLVMISAVGPEKERVLPALAEGGRRH